MPAAAGGVALRDGDRVPVAPERGPGVEESGEPAGHRPQVRRAREGGGFAAAQARPGPGRIHHCTPALGAAERTLALLTGRAADAGTDLELRQAPHTGDLPDEVLRVADEVDASVSVIGLRRRSPVGTLLMGSAAQRILLDATRPVLAVEPRSS
ncbi:universal stress protein [Geodermatophilus sp. SYSU D01045]